MVTVTIGKPVYDKPVKTVRGVLDRAINILETYGMTQGAEFKMEVATGNVGFCSSGALNAAIGGVIPDNGQYSDGVISIDSIELDNYDNKLVDEAMMLVAREIKPEFDKDLPTDWRNAASVAIDIVIEFNDDKDRTTEDVLRVFKAARSKA